MKRKILWTLLIILVLGLGYIGYIVIKNNNTSIITKGLELNIESIREYTKNDEYIEKQINGLKLIFKENKLDVCYSLAIKCEEVDYSVNGNNVEIATGVVGRFNGKFTVSKEDNKYIFIKTLDDGDKAGYCFNS